ncbi:TPA: hypothetical protein ACHI4V_000223 [Streptococcus pyogenes]
MTKEYISYISATIFLLYGLLAAKWIFLGLGLILVLVGLADRLNSKKIILLFAPVLLT